MGFLESGCQLLSHALHLLGQIAGRRRAALIGDDPGTPGNGRYEINISYNYLHTARTTSMDAPCIDANYGLGDHIELSYQGGFLIGKKAGQNWQTGYDASLVGVKWRFFDEEKQGADVSVYPQLGFNTTSSFAKSGLAESRH